MTNQQAKQLLIFTIALTLISVIGYAAGAVIG